MSSFSRCIVIASVLLLTACGFRLQGTESYPDSLDTVYIDTRDRYTVFYRKLTADLRRNGAKLTDSATEASAVIRILRDRTGQSVLTVSARNVPTEYDVYYDIEYSVWVDGQEVLPARTIVLSQDYTYDPTLVLGKSREEETIREAIAEEVVRRVSQELSRL